MKQIGELFGKPVFTGRDVQRTFKKENYIYIPSDKIEQIKKAGIISGNTIPVIDEDDLTKGEYIDLGLPSGTLWCSHNLGATSPCFFGNYYAWGETTPKIYYSWSNYKYGNYDTLTKYNEEDNKTILDPEDDAVYIVTNGKARIPTKKQIDELISDTTNRWCKCTILSDDHTTHNVYGRLFTGSNGNSIFIPAAGARYDYGIDGKNNYFIIHSSSLDDLDISWRFSSSEEIGNDVISDSRCSGHSLRGVISK